MGLLQVWSYDRANGEHIEYLLAFTYEEAVNQVYIGGGRTVTKADTTKLSDQDIQILCNDYGVNRNEIEI